MASLPTLGDIDRLRLEAAREGRMAKELFNRARQLDNSPAEFYPLMDDAIHHAKLGVELAETYAEEPEMYRDVATEGA